MRPIYIYIYIVSNTGVVSNCILFNNERPYQICETIILLKFDYIIFRYKGQGTLPLSVFRQAVGHPVVFVNTKQREEVGGWVGGLVSGCLRAFCSLVSPCQKVIHETNHYLWLIASC